MSGGGKFLVTEFFLTKKHLPGALKRKKKIFFGGGGEEAKNC